MNAFLSALKKYDTTYTNSLQRGELATLQVNMGNLCNQRCTHCHIDASPQGKDVMSEKIVNDILGFLLRNRNLTLDITGGTPELNPNFDYLVKSARPLVKEIIVRSNLTVIFENGKEYLPEFFKKNRVHLICSLPCYTKENVDQQRGEGIFEKSLKALRILNELGYGKIDELQLDLVHNPNGSNLPSPQDRLEREYKNILRKECSIVFNRLITLTNAPIRRFKDYLEANGEYKNYTHLLEKNFNVEVLENLMCRTLLSVGWDGRLYDCDFNLALDLALKGEKDKMLTVDSVSTDDLKGRQIIFAQHCFACTAGSGSSCQGALDLSKQDMVRQNVKRFYQDAALRPKKELCCPNSYEKEDMAYIPKEVLDVSYGCGSPISLAQPAQGEAVVDLGCGAGIDCFIASKRVGISGKVIGVDMTEEMLIKANATLESVTGKLGFLNCEFRQGFLEDIPVESESIDLVASNCVLNLSSDKSKVFREIHRILKDGGRFVISDIVSNKEVPLFMREDRKLWGECISGALTQNEFLSRAKDAGFYALEILKNFKYKEAEGIQFCSITVRGYKLKKGKDCIYMGQYATYLGPYSEVHDDDEHIFPRGIAIEVCTDTANKLKRIPYTGQFLLTDVKKDGAPNPCCSSDENENNKTCC